MDGYESMRATEQLARDNPDTEVHQRIGGNVLSVIWNPDTGYVHRWDEQVTTVAKVQEYIGRMG